MTTGLIIRYPFQFKNDQIGVAIWNAQPTQTGLSNEQGLEAFYMAQITSFLEITFDGQVIINPQLAKNKNAVGTLNVRTRFIF